MLPRLGRENDTKIARTCGHESDLNRACLFDCAGSERRAACPGTEVGLRLIRPVPGEVVSGFGLRMHPILGYNRMNTGVDYASAVGGPVHAAGAGQVVVARTEDGYGKYVRIRHAAGYETAYAQLSDILVSTGQCVGAGDVIPRSGTTEYGAHLHFEMLINSRFVDPQRVRGAPE